MVCCVVDSVDTDSVDAKLREFRNITRATRLVRDGVNKCGGSSWLVIDTADVESVGSLEESWISVSN